MSEASFDHWAFFANAAQRMDAPLYATLARAIVDDDALRALAGKHRPGQPPPNLLFAAVHYLLLRGADHPLRAFYATLNGGIAGSGDPLPAFVIFAKFIAMKFWRWSQRALPTPTRLAVPPFCMPGFANWPNMRRHHST